MRENVQLLEENPEKHSQVAEQAAEKGLIGGEIPKNTPQGLKPCIDLIRLMRQLKLPHKTSFSADCEAHVELI